MKLEDLFLSVMSEMREIVRNERPPKYDCEYKMLRLASLLRLMLLDDSRLVDQVNKLPQHRKKIKFRVIAIRNISMDQDCSLLTWLNPNDPPLDLGELTPECVERVTRDKFLSIPVVHLGGSTFTINDVIRYFANVHGGIHREEQLSTNNRYFEAFRDSERRGQVLNGMPMGLSMISLIAGVVVDAYEPIENQIRQERQLFWEEFNRKMSEDGYV